MSSDRRIGILGGTFDPIHLGHLDAAASATRALCLDELRLLPCRLPPHRPHRPHASTAHRYAMAELAAQPLELITASDLELQSPDPSYTSDTLDRLRSDDDDGVQLFFVTGADAFAEIASWKNYPALLDRCHFVAVSRPGYEARRLTSHLPDLSHRMVGASRDTPIERVAATPTIYLVDADTRDVSSTDIRHRAARGISLEGLVPPEIASYIRRHGLYGSAPAATDLHD